MIDQLPGTNMRLSPTRKYNFIFQNIECLNIFIWKDTWRRDNMDALSALFGPCVGNPVVTGGFLAQKVRQFMSSCGGFFVVSLDNYWKTLVQWEARWYDTLPA